MSPHKSTRFTDVLKQTAVYWGNPTSDGAGGATFDEPVELNVRWEDRSELYIDMTTGRELRSSAVVFVSEDVERGGYLYLGTLSDLSSSQEADPLLIDGAFEVREFKKTPDRKGTSFVRRVLL